MTADLHSSPLVLVSGMPSVFAAVQAAGCRVQPGSEEAESRALAQIGRATAQRNSSYVVIAKMPDRQTRMWLQLVASQGVKVAVLSDGSDDTGLPDTIAILPLPASLADVLAAVGIEAPATAATTVIGTDYGLAIGGVSAAAQPAAAEPFTPAAVAPVAAPAPVPAQVPAPVSPAAPITPQRPAPAPVPASVTPVIPSRPAPVAPAPVTPVAPAPVAPVAAPVPQAAQPPIEEASDDDLDAMAGLGTEQAVIIPIETPDPAVEDDAYFGPAVDLDAELAALDESFEQAPARPALHLVETDPTPVAAPRAPVFDDDGFEVFDETDELPTPVTPLAPAPAEDDFEVVAEAQPTIQQTAPVQPAPAQPVAPAAPVIPAPVAPARPVTAEEDLWSGLGEDDAFTSAPVVEPVAQPAPVAPPVSVPPQQYVPQPPVAQPTPAAVPAPAPVPATVPAAVPASVPAVAVPAATMAPPAAPFPNPATGQTSERPDVVPVGTLDQQQFTAATRAHVGGRSSHLAPLLVDFASKGGVGKSSVALMLAERAAKVGGLNVAVIDGNRGQADLGTYLRLTGNHLPTILDAAYARNPLHAISTPEAVNEARAAGMDPLHIYLVLGASDELADPHVVTAEIYRQVIELCRTKCDLVVVDTQIVEHYDMSGIFDSALIPALVADGGWGIGLTDTSTPGLKNLYKRLVQFRTLGVPSNRLLTMVNRTTPLFEGAGAAEARATFGEHSQYIGHVPAENESVLDAMNAGRVPHDAPGMAKVLDEILYRVTGLPQFDPAKHVTATGRKGGLLAKLRGAR